METEVGMTGCAGQDGASGSRSLVISTLGAGGAERVLTTMANWWASRNRVITLITLDSSDDEPFYPLHPSVRRVGLGLLGESRGFTEALVANIRRTRSLRRAVQRAGSDAVISFGVETNILSALACIGTRFPVILSERCDPRFVPAARTWRALRRLSYPLADGLAVQTRQVQAYFQGHPCISVIPNALGPVPEHAERSVAAASTEGSILAMGRLVPQKGFDVLLDAFACLRREAPGWKLVILGDGVERETLQAQACALGVAKHVSLPGVVEDPFPMLAGADIFVLSSRFEGYPNALCEAMACGCAVVATDCPSGPAEIVEDGSNGLLVAPEDATALSQAMRRLIVDPRLRRSLATAARGIAETLDQGVIMKRWDDLVEQAARRTARSGA